MGLRKTGFLVLLYDICVMFLFAYLTFALGNANISLAPINPKIDDLMGIAWCIALYCFVVGFLFLLVGGIALIFAKNAGLPVVRGGVWLMEVVGISLFIVLSIYFTHAFREAGDRLPSFLITLTVVFIIMIPGRFLLKGLKGKRV